MRVRTVWLVLAAFTPYAYLAASPAQKGPEFSTDILPILKGRCGTCHGGATPAAGLDLTNGAAILKSGVITPGMPDESTLVRRLLGLDGLPRMPKGFAPLEETQIQLIKAWIAAGGKVSETQHWAYRPVVRPPIPTVKNKAWVRNPIDAFVLARLEKESLAPSPEASKETLIRRVSFDLVGLPPSLAEIDAFLKDKSPNAYEKVVDRLLASPHYGERQARVWLDLARYADTHGYEADRTRQAYLYRDWVIDAFNQNMPFDRFTIEQIAGDLLPNPTVADRVATGFHRNSMFNEEGGVDPSESMYETIIDRVSTTSTVWLGSTLACARCHDHKFDPFTQKDFYRLYAFFNNNAYETRGDNSVGQMKFYEPLMPAPSAAQVAEEKKLTAAIQALDRKLSAPVPESERAAWVKSALDPALWTAAKATVATASGSPVEALADGSTKIGGAAAAQDTYTATLSLPPGAWTGIRLEVLPDPSFPSNGPGKASSGNFILSDVAVAVDGKQLAFQAAADMVQQGYSVAGLTDKNGDTGWAIYPEQGKPHELVLAFASPVKGPAQVVLSLGMNSTAWPTHVIGRFRLSLTQAKAPEQFVLSSEARAALASGDATRIEAAYASVRPANSALRAERAKAQGMLDALRNSIPQAMVMLDKPTKVPLTAKVHLRGEFLRTGDEVQAGTIAVLPPMPAGVPGNRLGLAQWLVDRHNPLTPRIQVNRMWEVVFGRGIVETSEDFGTQGARPTHPELLDWLASTFLDKWDMKAINRLIVTSATYRQSSVMRKDLADKDPLNELLGRGPRFRLEAEMIRDAALAEAGLLNRKIGGPSVFPYQPDGIWDSPYSGEQWMNAKGEDRYRRGLYTFWKRTAPYPSFVALDAGTRESCVVRRIRTNTPLQALALLNDRAFFEAALGLAKEMATVKDDRAKLEFGFRQVTSRRPDAKELDRLVALLGTMRERVKKDAATAKRIDPQPEIAALAMVANVLLNLDEALTKS